MKQQVPQMLQVSGEWSSFDSFTDENGGGVEKEGGIEEFCILL